MKIETIKELQDQVDGNKRNSGQEIERLRKEVNELKECIS